MQPWSADANADEDVASALPALQTEDPGQDVDLVVGMIGALPRQTDSLHELGMAPMLGKHLVVRAASRVDEQDRLDSAFDQLSADDRARIVRERKRHRALAVFLHELGHALGALHEQDPRNLMNPRYDTHMAGYGGGTIALMRLALEGANGADRAAVARSQLELLRGATQGAWSPAEGDQEIASLEAMPWGEKSTPSPASADDTPAPPAAPAVPSAIRALKTCPELDGSSACAGSGPAQATWESERAVQLRSNSGQLLSARDRDAFARAEQSLRAGDVRGAYAAAKTLFASYPDVYAVQDLRCQLALLRWLDKDALAGECAAVKRLAPPIDAGIDAAR